MTIGVLSDSFNTDPSAPTRASQDVANGDLPGAGNPCGHPTPVTVQQDDTDTNNHDEGRALAELADAMAPGANLAFATAVLGDLDFASRINALRTTNHASVLVDDIQYLDEPFFQDGPIANAAERGERGRRSRISRRPATRTSSSAGTMWRRTKRLRIEPRPVR